MAEKLPKKFRKALRGDLDVKSRNAPSPLTTIRNPNLPKWDYKAGGYTRSIKEQSAYMKEKAQKKADKEFKEEAGFGDYALEVAGYASAAYLYFKLPKIGGLAGRGIRGIGKLNKMRKKPPLFDTTRMPKTQRLFHLENLTSNFKKRPGTKKQKSYLIRALLTGPGADKLEKDILKEGKPTATQKVFLKGKQKMREFLQKGQIITKKEFESKGKVKLLKKQNWGTGNITKKSPFALEELNQKLRRVSMKKGRLREPTGGKLPQFQTKGKQSLLTNQSVKSRVSGSSAGLGAFSLFSSLLTPISARKRAKVYTGKKDPSFFDTMKMMYPVLGKPKKKFGLNPGDA